MTVGIWLMLLSAPFSQETGSPALEAASVKPAAPLRPGAKVGLRGGPGSDEPGQVTADFVTLQVLAARAYDLKEYQVSGPDWLPTRRYELAAKVAPGTSEEQFRLMLQKLLGERFHLKAHRETQQVPQYDLNIAEDGSKFRKSPELPEALHGKGHFTVRSATRVEIHVRNESLAYLVERLSAELQTPVTDRTGLTGEYDYALAFARQSLLAHLSAGELRPDPLSALQRQLGLKLEPKRAPGEVLVIDSADKVPAEN